MTTSTASLISQSSKRTKWLAAPAAIMLLVLALLMLSPAVAVGAPTTDVENGRDFINDNIMK